MKNKDGNFFIKLYKENNKNYSLMYIRETPKKLEKLNFSLTMRILFEW